MTRESDRLASALWLQSGINAEVDDDFSSGVGAQDNTPGISFLVFLETKHADAHIGPRRGTLPVRRKLEHLRLERVCRFLIFLSLAFPTMEPRRLRPRQAVLLQRTLGRRRIAS